MWAAHAARLHPTMSPSPTADRLRRACATAAWAALLLGAAGVRAQALSFEEGVALAPPTALVRASMVASDGRRPPPDSAPWRETTLPDNWHRSRPGYKGTVWYRVPFEVAPGALVTHGLYLARNSASRMVFWVNGHRLAVSTAHGDPRLTELHRPIIYTVPALMLHPGTNYVYVRVTGDADYRHGLTRAMIGYGTAMRRAHYEPRYDLQITSVAILGALLMLAAVLAVLLWRADRKDPVLFWFGMTAIAGSVWSWQQLWSPPIAAPWLRDLTLFGLKYLYATPLLVLCLRFGRVRNVKGEGLLWALYGAGCIAAALVAPDRYPDLATGAATIYVALFAIFFGWLCTRMFQRSQWRAYLLALALAAAVVVHGYDLVRWLGHADYDNMLLAPYGTFFLILALGATVVERHFNAIRALDRANRTLEGEVAVKVREVEQSSGRVQAMLREQAVLRERQRIMADMHDGLGSALVSMLALVQSGRVSADELERRLNAALIELRAIVDSLEPVDGDLAAVLGNVRYRMRAALEQSGARVVWSVDDLPRVERLTPEVILSVERILLEVLSNALQHAQARTIEFSAQVSPSGEEIIIRVADDGTGFDDATNGSGRGLRSMNERARRAGLAVGIVSNRGGGRQGTIVTLTVPLRMPRSAATAAA